jgi:non-heme chloroperoxidase
LADRGLRCISYDRRGHGRSAQATRGYDFDTLSSDLNALIEQLGLHDITLVGHSMGCGEVVRYLTRYGGRRVARAVLIATITPFRLKTANNPDGIEKTVLEKARADLSRDRPNQVRRNAPAFFSGASKNTVSEEMMQWWTRMIVDGCSLKVMIDLHRMFTETDFRPELPQIKVPTLLIHGDIDVSTPLEMTGRKTAKLIPGSRLTVYENAAHGLPVTHADRLNADLLAFAKS